MRVLIYLLLFVITCPLITPLLSAKNPSKTSASAEGLRKWTNKKNQDITASLARITRVKSDKNKSEFRVDVTFKLKTGKKITFDAELLSKPHQNELKNWLKNNPTGIAKPSAPYSWPSKHDGSNTPKVEYVKFDDKRNAHLFRTAHFDFYSDEKLSDATISKCVAVFDSIVEAIDTFPMEMNTIPSEDKPRYQAILVSSQEKYMKMGGIVNSGGFFSPGRNLTVIPLRSLGIVKKGNNWVFDGKKRSFRTLIHELTHHSTSHWRGMPPWFEEGLADYMEAMPYQSGRFLFTNPGAAVSASIRKFKNTTVEAQILPKGVYKMRHVKDLFSLTRQKWNTSMKDRIITFRNYNSSMILMYFFMHEDGKGDGHHLIQWMHEHRAAVLSRRKGDLEAIFKKHIVRDRTYDEIENEIQEAMSKKGTRLDFSY